MPGEDAPLHEFAPAGLHDFMARRVDPLPRKSAVLDIGCGSGAWLRRLHRMGFTDLTGLDLDPPPLDFARTQRADLNQSRASLSRRFSLITSFEVAEHLENVGNLLASIAAGLEPDGVAFVTTPNIHALRARLRFLLTGRLPSFDEKGDPTHITPVLLSKLVSRATARGLRVAETFTYPERGTVIYGRPIRILAAAARPFLGDDLPGDSLCVKLVAA